MAKIKWDEDGKRKFHAGVSHGVVYPKADGEGYENGAGWNGLTGVTESPSGAEPNDLWADNQKYARLISGEDYSFTIEAYMYPEEFEACDGLAAPVKGARIGQQKRKAFGFSWQTKVGKEPLSKEVDERVVEMRFNNAQFESKVQQTIQGLTALNKKLKFEGAEKGLEKISDAAEKVNLTKLESAVENLADKFSAVEVIGVTALTHITNQANDYW